MIRKMPRRAAREPEQPESQKRPALNREQIVEAGLVLLDTVGLDGLTMRRLAEQLAVQAGALYRYVRDKDELLDLLAEAICAQQTLPDPQETWQAQLRAFATSQWTTLRSRRDAARLIAGTPPSAPARLRLIDAVLGTLLSAGFDPDEALQISLLLSNFVVGLVLEEESNPTGTAEMQGGSAQAVEEAGAAWFAALAEDQYPHLRRRVAALAGPDAFAADGRFRFGFAILLAGLEQRLREKAAL